MALAHTFGGGLAYWLDPDLPDELLATCLDYLAQQKRRTT